MNSLAKLLSTTGENRRLLARALATNIRARIALNVLSLERLKTWATRPGSGAVDIERVVWAGRAAARRTPFATCLSSALALQRLLARNGHASELQIGVAGQAGAFAAHAWLERDGRILIGEEDRDRYTRLASWAATPAVRNEQA